MEANHPQLPPSDLSLVRNAPKTRIGALRFVGPGLITAGAVVGSGELIATTKTGAQAGVYLLWPIVVGCIVKVFTQIELGRYTISSGQGTMEALNQIPGPSWKVNWAVWCWVIMFCAGIIQMGGLLHGAGQSIALTLPITGDFIELMKDQEVWKQAIAAGEILDKPDHRTWDDVMWSTVLSIVTVALLVNGRYSLVQKLAIAMVIAFTLITVGSVIALQFQPEWRIGGGDILKGLSFQLPPLSETLGKSPITTALATFGIIGIGANELISYPIWCKEGGYAAFSGPKDSTESWAIRARSWIRIMHLDAFLSMLIFTACTIAFYLLGATVLNRQGLDPESNEMILTLSKSFIPLFGNFGEIVFLFGAFIVLYSTFFAASASHSRVVADALGQFKSEWQTPQAQRFWIRTFCVVFPVFSLVALFFIRSPVLLIIIGGIAQALMLPMLGAAALYFRYKKTDQRLIGGKIWDFCLWISFLAFVVAGIWILFTQFDRLF